MDETPPQMAEVLDYQEPSVGDTPSGTTRLEQIFGTLPRTTAIPTWKPKTFRDGFAIDTTNNVFYFYDFVDNAWQSATTTDAHIRSLLSATSPILYNSSTGVISLAPFSGDGSDGNATLDGSTTYNSYSTLVGSTYTLSRDVFFDTLTINSGKILNPNGYAIFAKTGIYGAGKISFNGANGGNGTQGGLGGPATGGAGGTAGAATAAGTFAAGKPGQIGGAGASTASANGFAGVNGSAANPSLGVGGANAGAGGDSASGIGGVGGTAGAATGETAIVANSSYSGTLSSSAVTNAHVFLYPQGSTSLFTLSPSAGSASGGGGAAGSTGNYGGGGGGGSGSTGGIIFICATVISDTITIEANGGNGGNGGNQTSGSGGGGGGSGGSGGVLIIVYTTLGGSVTLQALAGSAGSAGTGVAPNNAAAGGAGIAGKIYKLKIT